MQLTVERFGRDSGEVGPGLRGKGLGELPGCSAVLLRGFAGVEAQRGGVSAAAQRSGGMAELGARLARVLEWLRRWIGCREVSRGEFKGAP